METVLADEIDILRDKKQKFLVQRVEIEREEKRIAESADFLQEASHNLTEYDEGMVIRRYIEQIKIYEEKFTVCFKAKEDIDINS